MGVFFTILAIWVGIVLSVSLHYRLLTSGLLFCLLLELIVAAGKINSDHWVVWLLVPAAFVPLFFAACTTGQHLRREVLHIKHDFPFFRRYW